MAVGGRPRGTGRTQATERLAPGACVIAQRQGAWRKCGHDRVAQGSHAPVGGEKVHCNRANEAHARTRPGKAHVRARGGTRGWGARTAGEADCAPRGPAADDGEAVSIAAAASLTPVQRSATSA